MGIVGYKFWLLVHWCRYRQHRNYRTYLTSIVSTELQFSYMNGVGETQRLSPVTCLLGDLEKELYSPNTYIALTRLFYLVRKLIARYWLSPQAPMSHQWIQQVNGILIRAKHAYQHRNAYGKFTKIWRKWLETPGVSPLQLIRDRLLQM